MRRHRPWTIVPAAVLVVALAGCGSEDPEQSDTPPAGPTTAEEGTEEPGGDDAMTTAPGDAGAETGVTVATADTDLGTVLVDGDGMTLYLFTNDSPGTSVCEGDCLAAWPPLEGQPQAGEGVEAALLGSIERSDGTVQATYNDWPLYYFAQDAAPGDVTGQAVNEVWWVISPEGEAVMEAPQRGGGYGS